VGVRRTTPVCTQQPAARATGIPEISGIRTAKPLMTYRSFQA
jgi:hypothetical protein